MRIVAVTDLHGCLGQLPRLPAAELALLGGDLSHFGTPQQVAEAVRAAKRHFPHVLAVLGNCDPPEGLAALAAEGVLPAPAGTTPGRLPVRVFGIGGANTSPFHTPNEWDDAAMGRELAAQAHPAPPAPDSGGTLLRILLTHPPPAGSAAERLPNGLRAGSRAVAEFARQLRPDWIVCGHLHESRGRFDLDGIPVVNPGPLRNGFYAILDWEPGRPAECRLERLDNG
ncbi:MAG: metallophosphoesterase [Lentisphaeria bacterium]|jgi:hypothetical protein